MTEYKQVIILRSDLGMSTGKAAAQAGHAAVSASEKCRKQHPVWWKRWMNQGQRKIILEAKTESDLMIIKQNTERAHIPIVLIVDQGLTELEIGTKTCLGIGPAPSYIIDKVTGNIPLFRGTR